MVRNSLETTSVGRLSRPRSPGLAVAVALAGVAEQQGRPDHRVEDDVVLAHEVVAAGVLARAVRRPPPPPRLRVAGAPGPLDRGGQVADHRVEPDVDPLVGAVPPAVQRDRHAPVQVPGDGARLEVVEQVLENRRTLGRQPSRLSSQSPSASANAGRSRKKCSVSTNSGVSPLILRPRVDQVDRVELVAAVVALVAAGAVVPADRAGALDVAVRQGPPGGRGDRAHGRPWARCSRCGAAPRRSPAPPRSGCGWWCG